MNFVTKTQNIKIIWIKETESALFISLCFGLRSISKFTSTAIKWSIKFRKNINDRRFYYGIGFAYFGPFKSAFECVLIASIKYHELKHNRKVDWFSSLLSSSSSSFALAKQFAHNCCYCNELQMEEFVYLPKA